MHHILAGEGILPEQPCSQASARDHVERADGSKELQRTGYRVQREIGGEQIEEAPEQCARGRVALVVLALPFKMGISQILVPCQEASGNGVMHLTKKRDGMDDLAAVGFEEMQKSWMLMPEMRAKSLRAYPRKLTMVLQVIRRLFPVLLLCALPACAQTNIAVPA